MVKYPKGMGSTCIMILCQLLEATLPNIHATVISKMRVNVCVVNLYCADLLIFPFNFEMKYVDKFMFGKMCAG
jgi:hypothetical protein